MFEDILLQEFFTIIIAILVDDLNLMSSHDSYYHSVLAKFPTKKKLYRAMVFGSK